MNLHYRGTLRNGEQIYEIRIPCGYQGGKQKRITKIIHASSKRVAQKEMQKFIAEKGLILPSSSLSASITFADFVAIWKTRHGKNLAPRTQVVNQSMLDKYILDTFGGMKLKKINANDIRMFIRYLKTVKIRPDRFCHVSNLSSTMIHKYFKLVNHLLRKAVEWKYLTHNPCEDLAEEEIPHPDYHHAPIWQKKQLASFMQYLNQLPKDHKNLQKVTMFYVTLITGLRKSELGVLTWPDIDFAENSITISKALKYMDKTEFKISVPKNKSSVRKVFFDSFTSNLLKKHQSAQQTYFKKLHMKNPKQFVFTTRRRNGELIPVTPSYLYIWLKNTVRLCGLPHIDVHSLRHMAATYALESGAAITAVQNMMGHTSIRTTSIVKSV